MSLTHLLRYYLLSLAVLGYRPNHRRPLRNTLRRFMTAYFQHYRAGYLVGHFKLYLVQNTRVIEIIKHH